MFVYYKIYESKEMMLLGETIMEVGYEYRGPSMFSNSSHVRKVFYYDICRDDHPVVVKKKRITCKVRDFRRRRSFAIKHLDFGIFLEHEIISRIQFFKMPLF